MTQLSKYARKRMGRKTVDCFAGFNLLNRARPYDPGEMDHEHKSTKEAFDRLRTGAGNEADFDRVSMMLNIGLIRAEAIAPEIVAIMQAGQQAMGRMKNRFIDGKSLAFDAVGLEATDYAIETYETVLNSSSPLQMINAIREAYKRIMSGELLEMPA